MTTTTTKMMMMMMMVVVVVVFYSIFRHLVYKMHNLRFSWRRNMDMWISGLLPVQG
jgi:hypothetical protein